MILDLQVRYIFATISLAVFLFYINFVNTVSAV